MTIGKQLGSRIRIIRKQQNRTLEEIAKYCGFTKSLLSKIENGVTTPPISTLMKIAQALGVTVSDLLEENKIDGTVYTPSESYLDESRWIQTEKGYSFYAFGASRQDKIMQPYYFVAKKGEIKSHSLSHDGEEFLFILAGEMKYRVSNTEYTLTPGDTLYFSSLEKHTLTPLTDEVRYVAVFAVKPE
ncbi:transcriptional regulator, XRE family with cupin sensor [Amphibacillus marinus]|uniref:Transcriptional regulator, XRE family with cupin sensor n=1 Tax=Amphibacillus marinus TaxID=872970 RepID=A0A1H8PS74_9BACI|nr:XRE family transcriptional regulator [Amphibacillus marinus]SEO44765.1 transcriptional regulator, XRE family with cupin sensor [Amphibacillus marinus]